jgi:hypothetical protein
VGFEKPMMKSTMRCTRLRSKFEDQVKDDHDHDRPGSYFPHTFLYLWGISPDLEGSGLVYCIHDDGYFIISIKEPSLLTFLRRHRSRSTLLYS